MRNYFANRTLKGCITATFIFAATFVGSANDIDVKNLPQTIKTFISANIKDEKIVKCEKETGGYEIKTESGTKIEFNQKGGWNNIENDKSGISQKLVDLLPYPASLYLKTNYNSVAVEEITRSGKNYIVELMTVPQKSKLLFTKDGKMKKMIEDY